MTTPELFGYWRSSAAYRVRIALNLKGVAYQNSPVDLRGGGHGAADYRALNPQGLVPTLVADGRALGQSPAILEWIEERYPSPPLLPRDPADRAVVRGMAALINCDIHPLNNLRVLNRLRQDFGASDDDVRGWIGRWVAEGFEALEALTRAHGGRFCFGDTPSLADCSLVPQVYSAERFSVDLGPYPALRGIAEAANRLPAFADAHPSRQPDADPVTPG